MKVLFTHSYFLKFDAKQWRTAMPYPPLGTLFAISYLRENGYEVRLFDTMFSSSSQEICSTIDEFQPDIFVSYDDGFNYLTKMCLTNMREACFDMQTYAKSKGCKVITSSSDSSDHYESYLDKGADVIVIGEGEQTLLEVCNHFKEKKIDLSHINGIAFYKDTQIIKTAPRTVIKDLDVLPAPAWDLIDIRPYKKMWIDNHGYFSINFVTTRGCPYKCNWCAKPIYGNRYNIHSVRRIAEQIQKLQADFKFTHVWFADDIFGLKPSWVEDFATGVKEIGLKFNYKIQSRADLLVDETYVKSLAESGCNEVWMGAESGSQRILDAMDKGTTVEEIKIARQLLKKYSIKAAFFLQFGYLGENFDDIQKTLDLVKETMPDDLGISVSYPLPGTKFYEKVKQDLNFKSNWTDSDELALMFKNTYPPQFYKTLHRLVHSIYRQQKAADIISAHGPIHLQVKPAFSYVKYATKKYFQYNQLKQNMVDGK